MNCRSASAVVGKRVLAREVVMSALSPCGKFVGRQCSLGHVGSCFGISTSTSMLDRLGRKRMRSKSQGSYTVLLWCCYLKYRISTSTAPQILLSQAGGERDKDHTKSRYGTSTGTIGGSRESLIVAKSHTQVSPVANYLCVLQFLTLAVNSEMLLSSTSTL